MGDPEGTYADSEEAEEPDEELHRAEECRAPEAAKDVAMWKKAQRPK